MRLCGAPHGRFGLGQRNVPELGSRRGTVLVQVALILTVWAALAALTLDLARVRTAREAMQNSLDHAVLEGLRGRDALDDDGRRAAAARGVRLAFDADLVEGAPEPNPPLGAGAIVTVAERDGVAGAGGFDPDSLVFWRPAPELNLANAGFGDFVAGEFAPGLGSVSELPDYSRSDFAPASAGDAGQAPALLGRLRRTRGDQALDRVPGISSAGPTISLLFGFGAPLLADPASGFDVRRDGLAVRATSIASSSKALAVALGPAGQGLLEVGRGSSGIALVPALDFAVWQALPLGAMLEFDAADDGRLVDGGGAELGRLWNSAGALAVADAAALADLPRPGELGLEPDPTDAALSGTTVRALAVQRTAASGGVELVGFAAVRVVAPGGPLLTVTKVGPWMAADRATARIPGAWLALEPGGPLERPQLSADHTALDGSLLAPVLVR